jgi:hypothetical protein
MDHNRMELKYGRGCGLDSSGSGWGIMAGFCEFVSGHLDIVINEEFLELLSDY